MPVRPGFHFTPARGRFGDPKPFVWEGRHHVFFQNSPASTDDAAMFAGMRWAHIVSDDLIHWTQLDDALRPDPAGPDAHGCWTGSVIRANGAFHIFYTGVREPGGRHQTVCHATSDDLVTWRKDPRNPLVVAQPPFATEPTSAWRDPQVVASPDGGWEMLLTADLPDAPEALRGCVARLASDDLDTWRVVGLEHHPKTVHRCECPDTFRLGDFYVLLYSDFGVQVRTSRSRAGGWQRPGVARFDDFRYYAAKTALDASGRRLMHAFLFGRATEDGVPTDSSPWEWGGSMALPRELHPGPDRTIFVRPARELEALRDRALPSVEPPRLQIGSWETRRPRDRAGSIEVRARRAHAADEQSLRLMGRHPLQLELSLDLDLPDAGGVGILLGCDPQLSRGYRLDVDRAGRQISLSRLLPQQNPASTQLQQLGLPPLPERVSLRLFLDGSILEAFVADRLSFSARLYGLEDTENWWGLVTSLERLVVHDLRAWSLRRT